MRSPAYLIQSRHNIFYFRVVIPPEIRKRFPGTPAEVRRSLGTREVKTAIRLARKMSVVTDEVFTRVMNTLIDVETFRLTIQQLKLGPLELNGIELVATHRDGTFVLEGGGAPMPVVNPALPLLVSAPATLLSEVIEAYCSEQWRSGNWTAKTEQEYRANFALLQEIVGDKPFASLGHAEMRSYKETLLRLPANLHKLPAYRGKSVAEVIAMNPAPMETNTVKKQVTRVSALFEWAVRHGYTDRSYVAGMGIRRKKKRDDQERDICTDTQVADLKAAVMELGVRHPHRKWVPLIGMYSGM